MGETQELAKGTILPSQGMFSAGCKESFPLAHFPSINHILAQCSAVLIREEPEDTVPVINKKASAAH